MIISPATRLLLLVAMVVLPIWQDFVSTSSDYSVRGLLRPIFASAAAAVVVIIARTKNPIVDGDPPKVEVVNTPEKTVETHETKIKK
jgi:hypothetical protein